MAVTRRLPVSRWEGHEALSLEYGPRVLDHVFAPIEVDRAKVAGFITVGVAIDF